MIVMLIAGIGAVLAGIVAIVLGLPVKEFSFGNTLILAGVVGVCTGIIVLALAVVVSELRIIARRLARAGRLRKRVHDRRWRQHRARRRPIPMPGKTSSCSPAIRRRMMRQVRSSPQRPAHCHGVAKPPRAGGRTPLSDRKVPSPRRQQSRGAT